MPICREIDRGEGDITEQACAGTFVQAEQPELSDDLHGTCWKCACYLGSLALDLETDFASVANISRAG